jgi:hypothetical protein
MTDLLELRYLRYQESARLPAGLAVVVADRPAIACSRPVRAHMAHVAPWAAGRRVLPAFGIRAHLPPRPALHSAIHWGDFGGTPVSTDG